MTTTGMDRNVNMSTPGKVKSPYRVQLEAQPCKCVSCSACKGSGSISVPTDGYPEWDLDSCYECEGGLTEVCDRCRALNDLDNEEQWEADKKQWETK